MGFTGSWIFWERGWDSGSVVFPCPWSGACDSSKITLTKVKIQYMSSPVFQRVTDLFVLHLMAGRNVHDFVCMCVYVRERKNEQLSAVRKLGVQVPQKENNFVSIAVYFFSVVASKYI